MVVYKIVFCNVHAKIGGHKYFNLEKDVNKQTPLGFKLRPEQDFCLNSMGIPG